jgi:hypothetical protein
VCLSLEVDGFGVDGCLEGVMRLAFCEGSMRRPHTHSRAPGMRIPPGSISFPEDFFRAPSREVAKGGNLVVFSALWGRKPTR